MPTAKRIQVVMKALAILRLLAAEGPMRFTTIATRTDMHKSSLHLMLTTLADAGFVRQDATGMYRLGWDAYQVGIAVLDQYDLSSQLGPPMERLAQATNEAVSLAVLHSGAALIVMRFETEHLLRTSIREGTRMPLDRSASGRCLIAFTPEQERHLDAACLTQAARRRVEQRIRPIRDAGFEIQRDEWANGISSIAMPVFGRDTSVIAAVSVSSPSLRFTPDSWSEGLHQTAETLTATSQAMALHLHHLIPPS